MDTPMRFRMSMILRLPVKLLTTIPICVHIQVFTCPRVIILIMKWHMAVILALFLFVILFLLPYKRYCQKSFNSSGIFSSGLLRSKCWNLLHEFNTPLRNSRAIVLVPCTDDLFIQSKTALKFVLSLNKYFMCSTTLYRRPFIFDCSLVNK